MRTLVVPLLFVLSPLVAAVALVVLAQMVKVVFLADRVFRKLERELDAAEQSRRREHPIVLSERRTG